MKSIQTTESAYMSLGRSADRASASTSENDIRASSLHCKEAPVHVTALSTCNGENCGVNTAPWIAHFMSSYMAEILNENIYMEVFLPFYAF